MKIDYDVIIIGAGASGLTSAMYSARSGLKTAVIEKGIYGGQLQNTGDIENYTGFSQITGAELSDHMYNQATDQGVEYMYGEVESIEPMYEKFDYGVDIGHHLIHLTSGELIKSKAVVIATGVQHRHLDVDGEEEFAGKGVSYCAICDGAFFKGGHVVVIGGGDSALEEANYLAGLADRVTLVHRRDKFRGQKVLQDRVFNNSNIETILDSEVVGIIGDKMVEGVSILTEDEGDEHDYFLPADGIFIQIGLDPITEPFKDLGVVNNKGYIETDDKMQTSVKGIFAVGDVREKTIRQIATAVGDGAIAGTHVKEYIDSLED